MAKRVTVRALRERKGVEPIVGLTAYTAPIAALMDPLVDMILVGDSLGMVIYGRPTTVGVELDDMIRHGRAVARACGHACVVVDLPFGSYQESPAQAFRSSARVLKQTGAAAVKLEGGVEMAETIRFLVERGVPVLAHIGLMPQQVNLVGFGKERDAERVLRDGRAVAEAGAFAAVVENVTDEIAAEVTPALPIPTIGIGAGRACDGQIQVVDDLIGLTAAPPSFARSYAAVRETIAEAVGAFAADVRGGRFPKD